MTVRARVTGCVVAVLSCMTAAPVSHAQDAPRFAASAGATSVNASSILANGSAEMSGMLYGGEGRVMWNRLTLRLAYAQGGLNIGASSLTSAAPDARSGGVIGILLGRRLTPGTTAPSLPGELEMAEASGVVGYDVIDGLEIGAGVHGRARINDSDSERLLLWIVRARYETPIVEGRVRGFLEGWNSVAGSASATRGSGSGRGGTAGALIELGHVGLRLAYGIDESRYSSTVRRETVEGLSLSLGYVMR